MFKLTQIQINHKDQIKYKKMTEQEFLEKGAWTENFASLKLLPLIIKDGEVTISQNVDAFHFIPDEVKPLIKKVIINPNVEDLDGDIFANCPNLTQIEGGSGVKCLNYSVFEGSDQLEDLGEINYCGTTIYGTPARQRMDHRLVSVKSPFEIQELMLSGLPLTDPEENWLIYQSLQEEVQAYLQDYVA